MTMTDPIADMLTRIRNANNAGHKTVEMPASKQEQGYCWFKENFKTRPACLCWEQRNPKSIKRTGCSHYFYI